MFRKSQVAALCIASSALAVSALAQNVYPVQRQSPEQQKQDESRCGAWATQQSGFDPAKPWLAPQASTLSYATGSSARLRGATASAIAGGRLHPDAGDAAVAGAIVVASAQPIGGAVSGGTTRRDILAAGSGADGAIPAQASAAEAKPRHAATDAAAANAEGTAATSSAGTAAAAIVGRDAGNAVAGGAVAGATVRRDTSQMIVLPQEQAAPQQPPGGQVLFEKARSECLEARGYAIQ